MRQGDGIRVRLIIETSHRNTGIRKTLKSMQLIFTVCRHSMGSGLFNKLALRQLCWPLTESVNTEDTLLAI